MKKLLIILFCALCLCSCGKIELTEIPDNTENTAPIISQTAAGLHSDNMSVNAKSPVPSKVCGIAENDLLFYSDKEGIYLKSGENTVKLSEREAMALTLYNGLLYFITPENGGSFPQGKVYSVDPETKEECCIINQSNISNLFIADDTVYYTEQTVKVLDNGNTAVGKKQMKCGLSGENPVKDEECLAAADGEYKAFFGGNQLTLSDSESSAAREIKAADRLCIYGGKAYYIEYDYDRTEQNCLCVFDLENSTEKITAKTPEGGAVYFEDYGFYEGEIYLYDCTWFYKVTKEGIVRYEADNQYTALYSAFDGLYGLKKDGRIARLIFTEDKVKEEVLCCEN
ncbi:MAG: hypothetical protein ACI4J1_09030 [Ruminiclostridium sp.]